LGDNGIILPVFFLLKLYLARLHRERFNVLGSRWVVESSEDARKGGRGGNAHVGILQHIGETAFDVGFVHITVECIY